MSYIANPFVAVLDANVLYPFRIRDVLLTFSQQGLFRARFTECIIDEWVRNLTAKRPDLADSIEAQVEVIRANLPECFVTGYEPLIAGLTLPDPDDRHVLAAAIRCSAQVIVTFNEKDFPEEVLSEHDTERLTPDDFLVNTFDLYPNASAKALRTVRKRYMNPPFDKSEFLLDLTSKGLPKLAAAARPYIEFI